MNRARIAIAVAVLLLTGATRMAFDGTSVGSTEVSIAPPKGAGGSLVDSIAPIASAATAETEPQALDTSGSHIQRMAEGATRIRVLLNEEPLENAELFALPWTDELDALAARSVGLPESARDTAVVVLTGVDGTATFSIDGASRLLVAGRGPGSAPAGLLTTDIGASIDLVLPPEQVIHGSTWAWPEKTRLPGALVRARRAYQAESALADAFDPIDRIAGMFFWSEVRTDGGSLYSLGGLPAARVFVIATYEGRSATHYIDRVLPVDEPISLSLNAGRPVSGTVLDAEGSVPLEGVRVLSISQTEGFGTWESDHTVTDARGRFALSAPLEESDAYGVKASLDGYATTVRLIDSSGPQDLTLLLRRAPAREIRVTDEGRRPIVGADVRVYERESDHIVAWGRTDAEGSLRVPLDPETSFDVCAWTTGYAFRREYGFDIAAFPVTLVLEELGALEGVVTSAGAPVAAAVVRARRERGIGKWLSDDRVETDPIDGSFRIPGLTPGGYVVDAYAPDEAPGHAQGRLEFTIEPGQTKEISIELPRGTAVSGVVRSGTTGVPIAGALVSLADLFRHGAVSGAIPGGVTTDAAGTFVLPDVPPGPTRLLFEHDSYITVAREIDAAGASDPLDIRLDPPASLSVTMRAATDSSPVEFMVILAPDDGREEFAHSTTGEVRFDHLPPGPLVVTTHAPKATWNGRALRRNFARRLELRAGESRAVEFVLGGSTVIRGSVAVPAGLGVSPSDLWVLVQPNASSIGRGSNGVVVDRDGTFELPMAPHGDLQIALVGRKDQLSISEVRRLSLVQGEEAEVHFRPPTSGLRGRVTEPSGRGLRGSLRIRTVGRSRGPWTSFSTDDDGSFHHLRPPGPIEWTAHADGFGTQLRSGMISDEQTVLTERVVLRPEASVTVHVTDLGGSPIDTAVVTLTPLALPDAEHVGRPRPLGVGRWTIRRIGEGAHTLTVTAAGFVTHHDELSFAAGSRHTKKVRLHRAVDLELLVVDRSGEPLPHEPVRIRPTTDAGDSALARSDGTVARTDASGRLVVRLPEGIYELIVRDQHDSLDLTGAREPVSALLTLD